ncbi:hypothetical protein BDW74DRAFT_17712 [Aspergillus multicolor]|uniref:uncharacterized protein n=1 Tax=Aspergillus multicolor TaxID=41759 RepID=UPI003CCD6547
MCRKSDVIYCWSIGAYIIGTRVHYLYFIGGIFRCRLMALRSGRCPRKQRQYIDLLIFYIHVKTHRH